MKRYGSAGVDEAGRGPLAGPVAVGVVYIPPGFDIRHIPGIRDSKQMTPAMRDDVFARIKASPIKYAVAMVGASTIDARGIQYAVRTALQRALRRMEVPKQARILLDGGLYAPRGYCNQETIIGGDSKEAMIGAASIMAKVTRDRYMLRQHARYPEYGFKVHKGYGTVQHRHAIRKYGLTPLHRSSFCTRCTRIV